MTLTAENTHYIRQYQEATALLAQQKLSKLNKYCMVRTIEGDRAFIDHVGEINFNQSQQRFEPISLVSPDRRRRRLTALNYNVVIGLDKKDVSRMMNSGNMDGAAFSKIQENIIAGWSRLTDRVIAAGAVADVYTGETGDTLLTAANDGVVTVDGTTAITYEDMVNVRRQFIDNDIPEDLALMAAMTGEEQEDLYLETELLSTDYVSKFYSDKGVLKSAVGMDIVLFGKNTSSPVLNVASGVRKCFAMAQGAVSYGILQPLSIVIEKNPNFIDTWQMVATGAVGAVRNEGKMVVLINTTSA